MQEVQENQDYAKQQSNVPQMIENVLKNEGVQALLFSIAKAIEGKVTTPAVDGVASGNVKLFLRSGVWSRGGVTGVLICGLILGWWLVFLFA